MCFLSFVLRGKSKGHLLLLQAPLTQKNSYAWRTLHMHMIQAEFENENGIEDENNFQIQVQVQVQEIDFQNSKMELMN